jgi:hypothetical protein
VPLPTCQSSSMLIQVLARVKCVLAQFMNTFIQELLGST